MPNVPFIPFSSLKLCFTDSEQQQKINYEKAVAQNEYYV